MASEEDATGKGPHIKLCLEIYVTELFHSLSCNMLVIRRYKILDSG